MVETKIRHPMVIAVLAGMCALVFALALIGPRGGSWFGVGDASATSPDVTEATDPEPDLTIPDPFVGDDGVVLTAPGELTEVFVPPVTSADVTATGSVAVTTTAPSVSSPPPAPQPTAADTVAVADEPVVTADVTTSTTTETGGTDGPGDSEALAETTGALSAAAGDDGALLLAAPEMSGTARGTTAAGPQLVAQLGTRDANSTPWMLLIAANFAVMVAALVFLRLRR